MPKFLVGCLVVVLVLVGAGGTAGYFFVIKPAWDFAGDMQAFVQEYERLNEQIDRTADYRPPDEGGVGAEQFQRFLIAQRDMRQALEDELAELEQRLDSIRQQSESDNRTPGIRELFSGYQGLGDLLVKAKRAQVDALNRYNFSLQEYLYVRNRVYRALGEDVAVAAFGDQMPQGGTARVSDELVSMVTPHREELMASYALAWFGL
jgi:hypothetical protein